MPRLAKESRSEVRIGFFELLFGDEEGIFCLATSDPKAPRATWRQHFFEWPKEIIQVENLVLKQEKSQNIYFCVNLLDKRERKKENCLATNLLWADLDDCDPMELEMPPPILVQSSPGRYQGYWRLNIKLPPYQAEDYSKRIAYSVDADKSGWDLTQMLRVPFTQNFNYPAAPTVQLVLATEKIADSGWFEKLQSPNGSVKELPNELPKIDEIIYKYANHLRGSEFNAIYSQQPEHDWSGVLWRLENLLFDVGMSAEEVFVIADQSPCNKYARDKRPPEHLWNEIIKCQEQREEVTILASRFKPLTMPQLVTEPATETFIDKYRDWAIEATDAVPAFHDLCCTIMLSAVVANSVRLETSHGEMHPNLWGMILGDSTLTRKSTAMRMVINLLSTIDDEVVIATDGSPEGLLTGLESRPNKVSLFFKDEVSGFFDSLNRKDYLAGMPEFMTQLYDVPPVLTRRLRKGTVRVERPSFIFFGGGIPERVYASVTEEYIISGFLPRFLVVAGENKLEDLRPTGPPSEMGIAKRAVIMADLADLWEWYAAEVPTRIGGELMKVTPHFRAELTQKAWNEYDRIEQLMVQTAYKSSYEELSLPTFDRMSKSILKMGIVLGASRQKPKPGKPIQISHNDIINAAWYIQDWGRFSIKLILSSGKSANEKTLDKVIRCVEENSGILHGEIMKRFHLSKRQMDEIMSTLMERGVVRKEKQGRGWRYYLM